MASPWKFIVHHWDDISGILMMGYIEYKITKSMPFHYTKHVSKVFSPGLRSLLLVLPIPSSNLLNILNIENILL